MEYQPKDDPESESMKQYYMWYESDAEDAVAYRKKIAKTVEEYKKRDTIEEAEFQKWLSNNKDIVIKIRTSFEGLIMQAARSHYEATKVKENIRKLMTERKI